MGANAPFMSEFKFSCPNCQQNISATPEYSGLQINCPSCQTPMVVPQAPGAPAPAPAPHGPRISMAASESHKPVSSLHYTLPPVPKKKSKTGFIAGWAIGGCVAAALIYFGSSLAKKYGLLKKEADVNQAETNAPPPPPPELTTEEILQKVNDAYKGLSDYAAKGQTTAALDLSGVSPGKGMMNLTSSSSLQLGRTNFYRLEWSQNVAGKDTSGAAWNAGRGDFVGYGAVAPRKVKSRLEAMMPASASLVLGSVIAETFFGTTNSVVDKSNDFTKTNAVRLNGVDCYVLVGIDHHQTFEFWVDKHSFLVAQVQLVLGGKMDEAELKKLPSEQRNAMMMMAKLKGTVTETYDSIQTNQNLTASAFTATYTPSAAPVAAPQRPSSMAGAFMFFRFVMPFIIFALALFYLFIRPISPGRR